MKEQPKGGGGCWLERVTWSKVSIGCIKKKERKKEGKKEEEKGKEGKEEKKIEAAVGIEPLSRSRMPRVKIKERLRALRS